MEPVPSHLEGKEAIVIEDIRKTFTAFRDYNFCISKNGWIFWTRLFEVKKYLDWKRRRFFKTLRHKFSVQVRICESLWQKCIMASIIGRNL